MIRILQKTLWPFCVVANTAPIVATAVWFPQFLSRVSASVTVLLLLLFIVVEEGVPYRSDWSMRGDPELWRDVGHTLAYAALAVNSARVLFLGALAGGLGRLGLLNLSHIWPTRGPQWLQVLLIIGIGDLLEYGYHRLSHIHPWLWRIHSIHHSPVRLSVVKGARHHFLYAFGRGAMVWLPLLLLGAPASLVYWQFIAVTIAGLPAHANVKFCLPRWLHRLAVTPDYHRIHHAVDRPLGNSNFSVVFPFWDMVFGTHSDPVRIRMGEVGLQGDEYPTGLVPELKRPFMTVAPVRDLSNERA